MRGLSPLIATTILIVIAVALGVTILTWQSGFLDSLTGGVRESVRLEVQCSQASIFIESTSFNCQNSCQPGIDHMLAVQATNRGNIPLTVTYVYLKNTTGGLYEYPFFQDIGAGQTLQFVNTSRQSCEGISRNIDEVLLLTNCIDTSSTLPGESILWLNC